MSIDTTKPSTDLDFAVAEAVGIKVSRRTLGAPEEIVGVTCVCRGPFCPHDNRKLDLCWAPSTDWRHAVEAAERVGLFGQSEQYDGYWLTFGHAFPSIPTLTTEGNWVISVRSGEVGQLFIAPTGPLAICAAILKEPA